MIATGLNVLESLLSISMILIQECGCGLVVNNRTSGDEISGSSPCMGDLL